MMGGRRYSNGRSHPLRFWSGRALRRLNFKKMSSSVIPQQVSEAILQRSEPVPDEAVSVQGPDFDEQLTLESLLQSYERIGFQANSLGKAIKIVDKMVGATLSVDKINWSLQHLALSASLAPLRRTYPRR
jgi:hypothetical protein